MAASPYNLSWTAAQWQAAFPNDPKNWTAQQHALAHPIAGTPADDGKGNLIPPPGMNAAQVQAVTDWAHIDAAWGLPDASPSDQAKYGAKTATETAAQSPPGAAAPGDTSGGVGLNIPPPPASGSGSRTTDKTYAPKAAADAPIGIPVQQTNQVNPDGTSTTGYTSNYVPPMWIAGKGPRARTSDRPFDANPSDPGSDLPHKIVHSDGTVTYDWYRNRDVYGPATQNPADIQSIQQKMVQAGILDPSTVHYGIWDDVSQQAYSSVLGQANLHGVDSWDMLGYMAQHPTLPQLKLDNPLTAQEALETVFEQALGRKATNQERERFAQAWAAQQEQQQSQAPTAGPVTAPASLGDFAQQYTDTNYNGEEHSQGMLHGLSLVHNLITSTTNAGG